MYVCLDVLNVPKVQNLVIKNKAKNNRCCAKHYQLEYCIFDYWKSKETIFTKVPS